MPADQHHTHAFDDEALLDWRRELVTRQLDDVNALIEALVAANNGNDAAQIASTRTSLERFILAMSWSSDQLLPAIIAYASEHAEFEDDLFAPALILSKIAPRHEQTTALLARVPQAVRELLARIELVRPL